MISRLQNREILFSPRNSLQEEPTSKQEETIDEGDLTELRESHEMYERACANCCFTAKN